jgi:hypothetical protein
MSSCDTAKKADLAHVSKAGKEAAVAPRGPTVTSLATLAPDASPKVFPDAWLHMGSAILGQIVIICSLHNLTVPETSGHVFAQVLFLVGHLAVLKGIVLPIVQADDLTIEQWVTTLCNASALVVKHKGANPDLTSPTDTLLATYRMWDDYRIKLSAKSAVPTPPPIPDSIALPAPTMPTLRKPLREVVSNVEDCHWARRDIDKEIQKLTHILRKMPAEEAIKGTGIRTAMICLPYTWFRSAETKEIANQHNAAVEAQIKSELEALAARRDELEGLLGLLALSGDD